MNGKFGLLVVWLMLFTVCASAQTVDVDQYLNRARKALRASDFDAAAKAAKQGLALKKDFRLYCNLGMATEKLKQMQTSLSAWRACIKYARSSKAAGAKNALAFAEKHASTIEAELKLTLQEYVITSTPSGAFFFVDNKDKGIHTTPTRLWLSHGAHRLVFTLQGYPDKELMVKAVSGKARRLNAAMKSGGMGTLSVVTQPPGALLTVGGKTQGKTPKTAVKLKPGSYRVSAELEGYTRWEKVVQVAHNKNTALEPVLQSLTTAVVHGDDGLATNPWPWVVTGVGAAIGSVGIYYYVSGLGTVDDINALRRDQFSSHAQYANAYNKKKEELESAEVIGLTLDVIGALAFVGGAVWGVLDLMKQPTGFPNVNDNPQSSGWHVFPVWGAFDGVAAGVRF